MTAAWEYFGRRNAQNEIVELYRMPAGIADPVERFAGQQRLRMGLFWLADPQDGALSNEWASGWFDFDDDRLSEQDAARIVADWATRETWPGRP